MLGIVAVCVAAPPALATARPIALGTPPTAAATPDDLAVALASLDGVRHRLYVDGAITLRYRRPMSPLWVQTRDGIGAILQAQSPTVASISVSDAVAGQLFASVLTDGAGVFASGEGAYEALAPEDAESIALMFEPRRQVVRPHDLTNVRDVVDLGSEAIDGRIARHVQATLTPDYGRALATALAPTSGGTSQDLDIAQALDYAPGRLDVWITQDGSLVREAVSAQATVVQSKLGAMSNVFGRTLGGASIAFEATFRPFDVGGPIAISAPDVAPSPQVAPGDVLALTLLLTADDAANTYAKVRGSYAGMTITALKRIEPSIAWTRRQALATKHQVRVRVMSPRRVVLTTRAPTGRSYMLSQPLNGTPRLTCAFRGKSCAVGQLARFTAEVRARLAHARRRQVPRS